MQGSCGISKPFGDGKKLAEYLANGDEIKLRRRLDAQRCALSSAQLSRRVLPLRSRVHDLLALGRRLPQELVGWEVMQGQQGLTSSLPDPG